MTERTKITLDESEIPRQWYNVIPDLPAPPPAVLHPLDEIPGLSTNSVSQGCLEAIEVLEMCGDPV